MAPDSVERQLEVCVDVGEGFFPGRSARPVGAARRVTGRAHEQADIRGCALPCAANVAGGRADAVNHREQAVRRPGLARHYDER